MSQGYIIWFTGLSGAGKSTIAAALAEVLREREQRVEVLDGDVVRTHLSKGLGFSKEDRDTNVRRIGWVCDLVSRHGGVAIAAAISPYRQTREEIRASTARFVEVYIDCPLEVCIDRDVKGLYAKALAGEIPHFTGVSDPYEPPINPEVVIPSHAESLDASVARIVNTLEELGYLPTVAAVEEGA